MPATDPCGIGMSGDVGRMLPEIRVMYGMIVGGAEATKQLGVEGLLRRQLGDSGNIQDLPALLQRVLAL